MRKRPERKTSTFLTSGEVASLLGITHRHLRRRLAAGTLPEPARDQVNNYRMWRPEEVEALRQQILLEKTAK